MIKTKYVIAIIISIGIVGVSFGYSFFLNENSQETSSFKVEIMTRDEFLDEQIRSSKTDNPIVNKILSKCGIDELCVVNQLQDISIEENRDVVLSTFSEILSTYNKSDLYCHRQAHRLGMFLYDFIGNLQESFLHADQRCGGAVFHGIVQNYFISLVLLDDKNLNNIDISKICSNFDYPVSLQRWQCLHGLGHGLTEIYDYDVSTAVNRCDEFDSRLEQLSCSKGVFMENIMQVVRTNAGTFNDKDIFFPCNVVQEKYAPSCYHYQTSYILLNIGYISDSFKECDRIIPQDFVKYCYYGMGRELSEFASQDKDYAISKCIGEQYEYPSFCLAGMLLTFVNNRGTEEGFEFCSVIPDEYKFECYDGMGKWILMKHSDDKDRKDECSKARNPSYTEICNKASLEDILLV